MSDSGFRIDGLEEFRSDIDRLMKEYPEETSKKIYSLAGKFTKDVNSKFPGSYAGGKRPFAKSWKREREKTIFTGYTIGVEVRNTAPHFHLVENGHEGKIPVSKYAAYIKAGAKSKKDKKLGKVKKANMQMRDIGFVPGKHYCEKTRNEWQEKFPEEVENFIDKMLKEKNL